MTTAVSSKPLRVDGVLIAPRWDWSRTFRAEVAASVRSLSRDDRSVADIARQYVKTVALQNGVCVLDVAIRSGVLELICEDELRRRRLDRRLRPVRLGFVA